MAKWELLNNRHLLCNGVVVLDFTPPGSGGWDHLDTVAHAKRIVALLNAAEPGGDIDLTMKYVDLSVTEAFEARQRIKAVVWGVTQDKQVEAGAGQLREVKAPGDVWAGTKP